MTDRKPHSAEYFGDSRDYWWNSDFIALMARRWDVSNVRDALDVGCGVGHWGRVLSPHLPAEARIIGVDREPKWIERATEIARERSLAPRHAYVEGSAQQLPFADASFDLVTCQTVLIHVPDPRRVLREMLRVLRPGGLLIAAEPNNLANFLVGDSATTALADAEVLARLRFQLLCERGKEALGEGNNSIGGQLSAFLADLGLEAMQTYVSDKASMLLPPYAAPEERAIVAETLAWADREFWMWDRHDTRRFYLAGGGTEAEFEELWQLAGRYMQVVAEQMRGGTYVSPGGQVSYLVSGRKPR